MNAFESASPLRVTVNTILERVIPLVLYTDSKFLFDSLVGINAMTEKQLLIYLYKRRQLYKLRELAEVVWILSAQNSMAAMIKESSSYVVLNLKKGNKIFIERKSRAQQPPKESEALENDNSSKSGSK